MDIVCLQHVAFEGPALLETWLAKKGIALKTILVPESPLPEVKDCRAVIVMGGPMNIYQHRNHPWLVAEKKFLRQCLDQKVPVLGVCLGAQLLADVLGARDRAKSSARDRLVPHRNNAGVSPGVPRASPQTNRAPLAWRHVRAAGGSDPRRQQRSLCGTRFLHSRHLPRPAIPRRIHRRLSQQPHGALRR